MYKAILLTGIGGFIGSVLRYLTGRFVHFHIVSLFPWGTFTVNILGSFVIGLLLALFEKGNLLSSNWNLFLTAGLCGGFTTFSSFSNDSFLLLKNKEVIQFVLYSGGSVFLGILALIAGRMLIRMIN